MLATFDAMAKFNEQSSESGVTAPRNQTAEVDFSTIIGRINSLETMVNKLSAELSARSSDVPRGTSEDSVPRGTSEDGVPRGTSEDSVPRGTSESEEDV